MTKEMVSCAVAIDMSFYNYYVDFMKDKYDKKK
jgi:hypothetical protein